MLAMKIVSPEGQRGPESPATRYSYEDYRARCPMKCLGHEVFYQVFGSRFKFDRKSSRLEISRMKRFAPNLRSKKLA